MLIHFVCWIISVSVTFSLTFRLKILKSRAEHQTKAQQFNQILELVASYSRRATKGAKAIQLPRWHLTRHFLLIPLISIAGKCHRSSALRHRRRLPQENLRKNVTCSAYPSCFSSGCDTWWSSIDSIHFLWPTSWPNSAKQHDLLWFRHLAAQRWWKYGEIWWENQSSGPPN